MTTNVGLPDVVVNLDRVAAALPGKNPGLAGVAEKSQLFT
jgi:hypothetical protein